jgi:cation:H+ antiporter
MIGSHSVSATLLGLLAGAVGVVVSGVMLARSGDVIAARTRLGGLWFGLVFLALATSLPELVTAGAAVRSGAPDLAAGDLFGSNMVNMALLAVINVVSGATLFRRAALDQVLVATHAISLTCIAAASILVAPPPLIGRLGAGSAVLLVAYLAGSWTLFRYSAVSREVVAEVESAEPPRDRGPQPTLGKAVSRFVLGAALIVLTAPLLVASTENVVALTGLSEGFLGAVVLGLVTSLPEAVASLTALRLGAADLAVANLFGSNAVNMVMFAPLDLLHPAGPVLRTVGDVHVVAGLASVVMMATALSAIVFSAKRRAPMLEPSSGLIILVYLASLAVLYAWRG